MSFGMKRCPYFVSGVLSAPAGCQALQGAIAKSGTYEPGSTQQLQFLAACVNANAHATGHQEASNSTTALGMYPVLSMFNHSCNPNLAQSSLGEFAILELL